MKFAKLRTFSLALIFFSNIFSPLTSFSKTSEQISKINKIPIDYLDQVPFNDYIVGPGDLLKITVSKELKELTSEVSVDGEGTIYLPRLNRIFVKGLTLNELVSVLNRAYLKFVNYPDVQITVRDYRPINVLVEGEVVTPGLKNIKGSYSFPSGSDNSSNEESKMPITTNHVFPTVFDAIRESGGITGFSEISDIQLIRKNNISNGSGKITTKLNLEKLLINGDNSQNIRIYDSDIIRVGKTNKPRQKLLNRAIYSKLNPKFINVTVLGKVNSPGSIQVSRASVLNDAILLAGGPKVLKGPVKFLRFNSDGSIESRKFSYSSRAKRGSYRNPSLLGGDMIFIGNSLVTTTNEVISEITAPFLGIFSTYGIIKALSD
ncbi:polysaccharide biosynthesis/export family protein [uncultured Prochlorococcus sp.]|uniref:polysaccharide biosynthesis/export family protein n=1 Tax=uncultured Prochlorococcus sp. TaxID=159733 RepID=UPI0025840D21|nr:polysaccharide biosynthesis/export family protein [uncultured Prochlorococcus sp.]